MIEINFIIDSLLSFGRFNAYEIILIQAFTCDLAEMKAWKFLIYELHFY